MAGIITANMDFYREKGSWGYHLKNRTFRFQAILGVVWVLMLAFLAPKYLGFIESREGMEFNDLVLTFFTPVDVSWPIFAVIYAALLAALVYLLQRPVRMVITLLAYCLLTTLRFSTIYLIPLEPSTAIIPLTDPFAAKFIYNDEIITKDLFFSGHVSTLFLAVLAVDQKILKLFLLTATAVVALLLMVQHVHFSIDVIAAPIFAWGSLKFVKLINKNKNFDSNGK